MESDWVDEPTACFLDLPDELLEDIFELAYDENHSTTGPICRRLLPFDRKERKSERFLECLELNGIKEADEWCKAAPTVMKLQRKLSLETGGDLSPSMRRCLANLAESCPNLCWFALSVMGGIAPAALSLFLRSTTSRVLRGIAIIDDDEALVTGKIARVLNKFPSVTSLSLSDVYYDVDTAPKPLLHITSLTIHDLYVAEDVVDIESCSFLDFFPALTHLQLDSEHRKPFFAEILANSTCPNLLSLSVTWSGFCFDETSNSYYGGTCSTLDHILRRFPTLVSLTLTSHFVDPATIISSLYSLPALTSFNLNSDIPASYLLPLVYPTTRHPSLRSLQLNMFDAERGWRIDVDGNGQLHPDHDSATLRMGPDWRIHEAKEPNGVLSVLVIEELVNLGRSSGIGVEGTAVDAVQVYHAYREEAIKCLLAYGCKEDDYTELEAFVGVDKAEKLVKENKEGEKQVTGKPSK